jgi:hypothetical protein
VAFGDATITRDKVGPIPVIRYNQVRKRARTSIAIMRQTVGFLACVASASAFLTGPAAVPGTARYNGAVNARSGLGLRVARPAVALRQNTAASLSMQTATGVDTAALAKAANEARGLAMDSIAAAKSGHLGLPLGCAEVLSLLFPPLRSKAARSLNSRVEARSWISFAMIVMIAGTARW